MPSTLARHPFAVVLGWPFACLSGAPAPADDGATCPGRFVPPTAPIHATDLNGVKVPDACFLEPGEHHVYVIGDWGGVSSAPGAPPVPADHRAPEFKSHHREFVVGVDNCAQQRVAEQMRLRAATNNPDYVLNVGDNFYWGGIAGECGRPMFEHLGTGQWSGVFESVYTGPGLDHKQWLGILGNHDYGGFVFTGAWDQVIAYTWFPSGGTGPGRWLTPAQYWRTKAWYSDFSVEYFFLDSNIFSSLSPHLDQRHNLCSGEHNARNASCGPSGPPSLAACPGWFGRLWAEQMAWLDEHLGNSAADWQIVVTHFPPNWGKDVWAYLAAKHGIDLIASGHIHKQELHHLEPDSFLKPTAYVISGGGGGITSEGRPARTGDDDQYGFVDIALSREVLRVEMVSHGGQVRKVANVTQRHPAAPLSLPGALSLGLPGGRVGASPAPLPSQPAPSAAGAAGAGGQTEGALAATVSAEKGWPGVSAALTGEERRIV